MSELTATATATDELKLTPPEPMPPVTPEKAAGLVPLSSEQRTKLDERVDSFIDDLVAQDENSPAFGQKIDQITNMGRKEMLEAANQSNRFLDRPIKAMDRDTDIGQNLIELRTTVERLDPSANGKLLTKRGFLDKILGSKINNYFAQYRSAQTHIGGILTALANGKDELLMDNAAIDAYLSGIALLYQQAYDLARSRCANGEAILAMGHCHMVGGDASPDSERRILIGGTEALPSSMFDPGIAYAALGHLHLAQKVGKQEHLRYCGSPLPLSFAEIDYQHQVLRIDLDGGKAKEIVPLPVPRAVDLLRVPARPAPLKQVIAELVGLDLPDAPLHEQPYLEVRVLLDGPEPSLRAQVEAALEGKPVRLAKIEPTRKVVTMPGVESALSLDQLAQLQPDDIFRRLWQQRFGEDAPDDQLAAFAELMMVAP